MTSPEPSSKGISSSVSKNNCCNVIPIDVEVSPDTVVFMDQSHPNHADSNTSNSTGSLDRRIIQDLHRHQNNATMHEEGNTIIPDCSVDGSFLSEEYFEDIQSLLDEIDHGDIFYNRATNGALNTSPIREMTSIEVVPPVIARAVVSVTPPETSRFHRVHKHQQVYELIISEIVGYFNRQDSEGLLTAFYDKYCSNEVLTVIHQWRLGQNSSQRQQGSPTKSQQEHAIIKRGVSQFNQQSQTQHQSFAFTSNQRQDLIFLLNLLFEQIPDAILSPCTAVNVVEDNQSGNQRVLVKMSITGSTTHNISLSKLNTLLPDIGKQLLVQHERLLLRNAGLDGNNGLVQRPIKLTPPQMMNLPISISTRVSIDGYLMLHFDEETNRIVHIEIHYFSSSA